MVRKDEIFRWFSCQPSHQRLDVFCTLASYCEWFELRFLNTYFDFLARVKAPSPRDNEILAALEKNLQLTEVDLHNDGCRRKLIFALTSLHTGNRIVASTIYRILCNTFSDLKAFKQEITDQSSLELHQIFTMAIHHPSFTYEEKTTLSKIYLCMQTCLPGLRPSPESPLLSPQHQSSPPDISDRSIGSSSSSSTSSCSSSNNSRNKPVQNERAAIRRNRNSPKTNGTTMDITAQLKEQLGKERLPKNWKRFENYTHAQLMECSDQEFMNNGFHSSFISQLRKLLNQLTPKSNGLLIPSEDKIQVKPAARVKTCIGPPNVQPAFNNTRSTQQQEPLRAGSSSSSGSSSLETCSPPSSPTDSSSAAHRTENHRKPYSSAPQPMMMLNAGTRPQTRVATTTTAAPLRGANNISYLRPINSSSSNRQPNSRAASQTRDLPFPTSLPYAAQPAAPAPAQQPAATTSSFMVNSSTPPPHLDVPQTPAAVVQPIQSPAALPVYNFGFLPMHNGDGTASYPTPYTYITSGPPPNSAGTRPPGPHEMIYSPTSYLVQGQIVAQPLPPHHGSSANGRPPIMDLPYLHSSYIVTRSDHAADYSRPPPPGSSASGGPSPIPGNISCFNCGASGHRGPQCQHISFDEIIKPSPA